jgi:hypothetical protein
MYKFFKTSKKCFVYYFVAYKKLFIKNILLRINFVTFKFLILKFEIINFVTEPLMAPSNVPDDTGKNPPNVFASKRQSHCTDDLKLAPLHLSKTTSSQLTS